MKNSIFARFACAFFIFWQFEDVLVLSTMWNDVFCSCVDDVSIWWQMFNFVLLCPKRWFQFHSILCYLPHIETIKYNNAMENYAVCRGTLSLLRTQTRQTQHSVGVGYPSSSNTGQAEHVSTATNTRRPEKTSPRWAQGIWVGTKVGYGCRALLLGP